MKLNSIIEEACDLLPRVLGEDVKLRLALDEETSWIQADPGQVECALFNLARMQGMPCPAAAPSQ